MYPIAKRVLDIVGAVAGLLVLAPLMLLIAIAIRVTLGAPVLFRHCRPGLRSRPFWCVKFRTMTEDRDASGLPLPDEQRLTRLGSFLRRTSLDELPQLWNVLRGEMSLVGPRPLELRYVQRYSATQRRRHDVLPGITGWAQVHGRNAVRWEDKFRFDVWYVDHRSFWVDLKILAMTVWKVLAAEGIRESGHATASEFLGSSDSGGSVGTSSEALVRGE